MATNFKSTGSETTDRLISIQITAQLPSDDGYVWVYKKTGRIGT
jgi:hypothetical protein